MIEVDSIHAEFDSIQLNFQARSRGEEGGARDIFRFELNYATEVEFCFTKSCQWKLQFPSIVDHSKI